MKPTKIFKLYILVFAFIVTSVNLSAQQVATTFVEETGYLLYLPEQYRADTSKRWPLVMFLHGSGESGEDIEKVKMHGPPKMAANGKSFPFILVSPQAAISGGWDIDKLYRMIQEIKKKIPGSCQPGLSHRLEYGRLRNLFAGHEIPPGICSYRTGLWRR